MTVARSHIVNAEHPGFYHLVSRCVRRAWLCGNDILTTRNFDHRRGWIERRLRALCEVFAVELYAYAVMSNHYHVVLRVAPQEPSLWSDEDVARRWLKLCPARFRELDEDAAILCLLGQPERLLVYRERLGSISWFMRMVNEPIGRWANAEDGCTGHFWEGRFKSQALLDEGAVNACMAYVDLNPSRAREVDTLSEARYTSITDRLRMADEFASADENPRGAGDARMEALVSGCVFEPPPQIGTLQPYIKMLRAEEFRLADIGGCNVASSNPRLEKVLVQCRARIDLMAQRNRRAFGSYSQLAAFAERLGQRWVAGMGTPN